MRDVRLLRTSTYLTPQQRQAVESSYSKALRQNLNDISVDSAKLDRTTRLYTNHSSTVVHKPVTVISGVKFDLLYCVAQSPTRAE